MFSKVSFVLQYFVYFFCIVIFSFRVSADYDSLVSSTIPTQTMVVSSELSSQSGNLHQSSLEKNSYKLPALPNNELVKSQKKIKEDIPISKDKKVDVSAKKVSKIDSSDVLFEPKEEDIKKELDEFNKASLSKDNIDFKIDDYSFRQVHAWSMQAAMSLFSYSFTHFNRDKQNNSEYFGPIAWTELNKLLFDGKKGFMSAIIKDKIDSRAIIMGPSVFLRDQELGKEKLWWMNVPVMVIFSYPEYDKKIMLQVEMAVGKLHIERSQPSFIAHKVKIKILFSENAKKNIVNK